MRAFGFCAALRFLLRTTADFMAVAVSLPAAFLLAGPTREAIGLPNVPQGPVPLSTAAIPITYQRYGDWLRFALGIDLGPHNATLAVGVVFAGVHFCFHYFGLFDNRRWFRRPAIWLPVAESVALFFALLLTALFALKRTDHLSRLVLFSSVVLTILSLGLGRTLVDALWRRLRDLRLLDRAPAAVVGVDRVSREVAERIAATKGTGYDLRGFVALAPLADPPDAADADDRALAPAPALGALDEIGAIIAREHLQDLFIADQSLSARELMELVALTAGSGVTVRAASVHLSVIISRVSARADLHGGIPIVDFPSSGPPWWRRLGKRAFDILLSAFSLALFALPALLVAIAIRVESRGPVFFRQRRVTRGRRVFDCVKFRSMQPGADRMRGDLEHLNERRGAFFKIHNDPRVTRVGRLLRRWSIDEAPQVWNVLRGEMSLVGPRPPLESELADYEAWHHQRFAGKAGLTGLWQVSGRHDLGFDEMVLLDIYYLRNCSLFLDLRIIAKTAGVVLLGRGAA
ncbi:MAG: exopolysaccharide biosynthesis polyprenyl glycosylphosphotransferase [Planctomycetes bacterium]|nr:exopolysaccharide biosynthesis polyprenyl glycosylphosphotransferase [Planctomycetota bacterium]